MSTIWKAFEWGLGVTLGFAVANLILAIPAFIVIGIIVAMATGGGA